MLPGGIEVIGIYFYGPSDEYKKQGVLLWKVLNAISSRLEKKWNLLEGYNEKLQLHICSRTKK